jgi:hypothetical protein
VTSALINCWVHENGPSICEGVKAVKWHSDATMGASFRCTLWICLKLYKHLRPKYYHNYELKRKMQL